MKKFRVLDVNGEDCGYGLIATEDEAEMFVERSRNAGDHVVEVDTVKEAAEEMLEVLKTQVEPLLRVLQNGDGYPEQRRTTLVAVKDVILKAERGE